MKSVATALIALVGLAVIPSLSAQPLLSHPQGSDELGSKWEWGRDQLADADNDGWIGWQIRTTLDEKIDPSLGSRFGGYIRWNNQSRWNGNDSGDWRNGLSVDAMLAGNSRSQQDLQRPVDIMILLRVRDGAPRQLIVSERSRPVHWRHLPVAWLGDSDPTQSFRLLASLLDDEQPDYLQRQLIRSLGLHAVADRNGYLTAMFNTEDWAGYASYIVESMALQKSTDVETFLVNVARDENTDITTRRVAISALSRYDSSLALDTLTTLSGPLNPGGVRIEAVESLGMYHEDSVAGLLHGLVLQDQNESVQEQAMHSLAWLPNQFAVIAEIAHIHGNSEIRGEAVQELAQLNINAAFSHLQQIVEIDPNERVRRQALEEMDMAAPGQAIPFLMAVSVDRANQAPRVRQEAVESLGSFDTQAVRDRLNELAWSDERERIRNEAVESLGDLDSAEAGTLLLEIARSHPSSDTREEALDQLADRVDLDI